MATLHKFVDSTPTSLTVNNLANYNFLNYIGNNPYWQTNNGGSAYHIQYVDITGHLNESIEIVLPSATDRFFNNYNFSSGMSTNKLTVITAPTPTIVDGKYHYVFPAGTFTYTQVAPCGPYSKRSGSNYYYNGMDITSATAGGPRWEDVDIPELGSAPLTPKTIEVFGSTTYQTTYITYYPSTSTYNMTGNNSSSTIGKIRYFELPPGDGKFETNDVSYVFMANAISYGQQVEYITPTSTSGSISTWDAGPSNNTRYILITASVPKQYQTATNVTSGDAFIPNVWGTGTIHSRVSGSWI